MSNIFSFSLADMTPFGLPVRIAGSVFDYLNNSNKERTILRNGKPYRLDESGNYVPDLSESWMKDAWRKEGAAATLGGLSTTWDASKRQWRPTDTPPPPPPPESDSTTTTTGSDSTTTSPDTPTLPPPAQSDGSRLPSSSTEGSPLESNQSPDIPYGGLMDAVGGLLDRQAAIRERELEAETQRYILQGALRQQGLKELSRRAIEQKNIEAWSNLQVARQYAQAQQATALATTAYLAGIPNYNVMQAMNEGMKAGMQNIQLQAPPPPQPRSYFRGVG